jgi:hypothetical protein
VVVFGSGPDDEAVPFQAVQERHQGGLVDAELGRDVQLGALRLVATMGRLAGLGLLFSSSRGTRVYL